MYAYVAFLVVLLNYGLETAYFRFSGTEGNKKEDVFSTALISLFVTTGVFIVWASIFHIPIAEWLRYPHHSEYVIWFALIVGLDAVSSLPMARLRQENKAGKFALINISNVGINIILNAFFLLYCLPQYEAGVSNFFIDTFYNPEIGVGYVFISNLVASVAKFLMLSPYYISLKWRVNSSLLKQMLWYGLPLLIAGLAGIVNETIDRIMLKRMLYESLGAEATMEQIGIYGAVYKISILITLFIQAFRYAAEPFFFAQEKEKNAKETYARVLHAFTGVLLFIFLGVLFFIDIIKYFIQDEAYWVGLKVVPVLLMANVMLGIYYNLSVWYKLSNHTKYGAYIALIGAAITIALNYFLIPHFGYQGSAWATLACYSAMVIISYLWGQNKFSIPYEIRKIVSLFALSFVLFYFHQLAMQWLDGWHIWITRISLLLTALYSFYLLLKKDIFQHATN
jgi:O-antigen/teichoic acid export membrane protein